MEGTTLGLQNHTEVQTSTYTGSYGSYMYILGVCVLTVIFVTGVIGNSLVIFVTGYKMKTTVNSIWFLNLAIVDLLFMSLLIYFIISFLIVYESSGLFDYIIYIFHLNMFTSVFFLTVISLDRCLCTWCVVWAKNRRTLVKARIICVFVWLLSICCSIPYVIYIFKRDYTFSQNNNLLKFLSLYMFMVGFLIPFLIITCSYIAIVVRIRRFPRANQFRKFRVLFVILAFFISWFPYHFDNLFIMWAPYNGWNESFRKILYIAHLCSYGLVFLSGSLNPILYVFMCDEYKKKLKRSLLLVFEGAFTEDHLDLH